MKTNADYSVFVSYDKLTFILVYIDNLFILNKNLNIINNFKNKLSECFCVIYIGSVSHHLDMFVIYIGDFVRLDQKSYLKKILTHFRINKYKPVFSPIDLRVWNSFLPALENKQADKETIFWYKAVMNLLMYIITMIWLNLGYTLFMVSQYYANLDFTHIAVVI